VTPSEGDVRAVLNQIIDPCSRVAGAPVGLVDLGLIRRLTVTPGAGAVDVHLVIGVTEYGCLLAPSFASEARDLLDALPGVGIVDIELDGKFDWEPHDMSVAYRKHLAERRAATNQVMLPLRESRQRPGASGPADTPRPVEQRDGTPKLGKQEVRLHDRSIPVDGSPRLGDRETPAAPGTECV
jgi:metal-sulfur cluster biosynthetic enzyme